MAGRSRKRGRRRQPVAAARRGGGRTREQGAPPDETRTSAPATSQATEQGPRPARPQARPPSRSEERNATARATLTPLAPGERPWALKIAGLIAVLIGGGDLVAVIIDGSFRVGNARAGPGGVVLFSVLMLICAGGMWQLRYWAVLGFQAILLFVILFFSLLLTRAANLLAVVAAVVVVGGAGYLFYKLVRVLGRLQLPKYPGR